MKLITQNKDSGALEFQQFFDQETPPYAILSHTWDKRELSYQDFISGNNHLKEEYTKIKRSYDLASQDGYTYLWIDTCCIDKTSSAELTEAINAMFSWYAHAQVCYAYLSDFDSEDPQAKPLAQAKWFTRGWTLQELIAPAEVRFYDQAWRFIGTRTELLDQILRITGIHASLFEPVSPENRLHAIQASLARLTVAQRMSWAAKRKTTRQEDIAYSLLGIFGVNMPMVYGQGLRAFQRLQEEIMKESNDLTILAWKASSATPTDHKSYAGVLATHPSDFETTGSYQPLVTAKFSPSFVMTNKGLQIDANVQNAELGDGNGDKDGLREIVMSLECQPPDSTPQMTGIYLVHQGAGVYVRCRPETIVLTARPSNNMLRRSIFISRTVNADTRRELATLHHSAIQFDLRTRPSTKLVETHPRELWEPERRLFIPPQSLAATGFHLFERIRTSFRKDDSVNFVFAFGRESLDSGWWACIGEKQRDAELYSAAVDKDWATVAALGRRRAYRGSTFKGNECELSLSKEQVQLGQVPITRVTLQDKYKI